MLRKLYHFSTEKSILEYDGKVDKSPELKYRHCCLPEVRYSIGVMFIFRRKSLEK